MPARRSELVIETFDDGAVVFDPITSRVHRLGTWEAVVLASCDGTSSVRELLEDMTEALAASGSAEPDAAEILDRCLDELARLGVLEGHDADHDPSAPPCIGCGEPAPPCLDCPPLAPGRWKETLTRWLRR